MNRSTTTRLLTIAFGTVFLLVNPVVGQRQQSSLVAIELLEMCKDQLPQTMPPPIATPDRPAGRRGESGARPAGSPTPPPR